jgi:K+-transporting ATPase ATPase B chain
MEKKAIWNTNRRRAIVDSFIKLNPRKMMGNPVMLLEVGSVLTTLQLVRIVAPIPGDNAVLNYDHLWLWFTVLFANFAKAMAECGKHKLTICVRQRPRRSHRNFRESSEDVPASTSQVIL